jgi:hypothetical protein
VVGGYTAKSAFHIFVYTAWSFCQMVVGTAWSDGLLVDGGTAWSDGQMVEVESVQKLVVLYTCTELGGEVCTC